MVNANNNNEYKRLSRQELLELLIEESERSEELERQLKVVCDQLASKELKINEAGSIAEAALALNGVFEAAQKACAQYIENVKKMCERQDEINAEREAQSKKKAELILNEAYQRARKIELDTRSRWNEMLGLAKEEIARAKEKASNADKGTPGN